MRISKLVGERTKEVPTVATVQSQALLMRAGYIRQVSNGIYTLLNPAKLVALKIENIIRQEMNKIEGQEVLFPVVMPKELWEESGRYYSIGDEMVKFKDRTGHDMLLGMTHEEAAVHACKNIVKSYDELPCMIYQIQTKFRDEARSRAGLIRVREFTMKDAYSFHISQEDLNEYYNRVYDSYFKIYKRIGLNKVIAVGSDTGMMGGKIAHEFMFLNPIGEDSIVICPKCGYKANMEVANGIMQVATKEEKARQEVFTGDAKTIEEVCHLLKIDANETIKAVCYAIVGDDKTSVVVFIRGDYEVNEAKLKRLLGKNIVPKDLSESELVKGNIGCLDLKGDNLIKLYDSSIENEKCLVTGANKEGYHIKNVSIKRDLKDIEFADLRKVKEKEQCSICQDELTIERGVEIGNIFQLGTKYTSSMNMTVHNETGEEINPIMGCYGIGVGRNLACIVEENYDDKGMVWNMNVAPWQVCLSPLRLDDEVVKQISEKLYSDLQNKNIEVLFDDRNVSAGIKFAESELIGIPIRVVISPRSLQNNEAEVVYRKSGEKVMVNLDNLTSYLKEKIQEMMF